MSESWTNVKHTLFWHWTAHSTGPQSPREETTTVGLTVQFSAGKHFLDCGGGGETQVKHSSRNALRDQSLEVLLGGICGAQC